MRKKFLKVVLPSMLAFAFSGLYAIVDGFFVGRNTGDAGLAAVNIAYPIQALMLALGTGIGMGAAVEIAACRGKGDEEGEQLALGNTLSMLLLVAVVTIPLLLAFHMPILRLLGASGEILRQAKPYTVIVLGFAVFQLFSTGLTPVLRSYEEAMACMFAMIGGFVTNIGLDALFVAAFQWGVAGAAAATVIGQAVTTIPCLVFLWKRIRRLTGKQWKPKPAVAGRILKTAISPFGLTMSPNLVLIFMNRSALAYGGEPAIAAYTVIAYIVYIIQYLIQGISDGSQPLISFYLGSGEKRNSILIRNYAYQAAELVAAVSFVLVWLTKEKIPVMFGVSPAAGAMVSSALPLFAASAFFIAFLRVTTSYFYSMRCHVPAYILVYGEPLGLMLMVGFLLPPVLGLSGVWLATPVTQMLLSMAAAILLVQSQRGKPA